MSATDSIYVIVVAAGSGLRFGSDVPKQFCPLAGKPVVMHAIENLRRALPGAGMQIVISESCRGLWDDLCREYGFESPTVVYGGATRWESVKNGIGAIPPEYPRDTIVLIHDGARPLISTPVVERVVEAAAKADGAIPAVAVIDSLRRISADGDASEAVDRGEFRAVQTPQGFELGRLREAYRLPYQPGFTDDASVMASAGYPNVSLVEGDPDNLKITNRRDIGIAEAIIEFDKRKS